MTKEQECMNALQCLYIIVPQAIADDIKNKVIDALNEVKNNCVKPEVIKAGCEHKRIRENISGGRFDECLDCGKRWG
jgi:hypothetical protein